MLEFFWGFAPKPPLTQTVKGGGATARRVMLFSSISAQIAREFTNVGVQIAYNSN